ncbi:MAG TPA: hypothetical protein VFQ54_11555 [Thermomicrobiales bacterium]|nr:hypothetical protein [Thermomicrobiales bacterium]
MELRKSGMSFQEIADDLGYANASGAYKAVMAALKKTLQEPTDELRHLELNRLDVMLSSLWPAIIAKNQYTPRTVEVALKVMDRRAALLGLDAPQKREDTQRVEVTMLIKRIAEESGLDEHEIIQEAERILQDATS